MIVVVQALFLGFFLTQSEQMIVNLGRKDPFDAQPSAAQPQYIIYDACNLLCHGSGGLGLGDGGIRKSKSGGGFGYFGHDNRFNHRIKKSAAI